LIGRLLTLAIACGAAGFSLDCARDTPAAPTVVCVQFAMRNGKIVAADGAISDLSSEMRARLKSTPEGGLEAWALRMVEAQLARLEKPYPTVAALSNVTGTWQQFADTLQPLLLDGSIVTDPLDPRLGVLQGLLGLSAISAITFQDQVYDLAAGLARFAIANPFESASVTLTFSPPLGAAAAKRRIAGLRSELRVFDGNLWRPDAYKEALLSYYTRRDLSAQVLPDRASNNSITIQEGKRIADLDLAEVAAADTEKVAWAVLNTRDFTRWRKLPHPGRWDTIRFDKDLGYEPAALPYLVQSQLEIQQLALSQIGYSFLKPRDLSATAVELVVGKVPDAAAPQAARPRIDPHAGIKGPQPTVAEQTPGAGLAQDPETVSSKVTRYVAPGLEYRPGQAVRAFLTGELQNLPKPWPTTITFTGGFPFGTLASVNASTDYVGMQTIHMPLTLSVRASADRTLHRYLNGVKQDELRTGPAARAELGVFRDRRGSLLQLYGEMQHSTVGLSGPGDKTLGKSNLNVVEAGGLYWYHAADAELPTWILARPVVRAGTGMAHTEPAYAVARLDAEMWQAYRHGFGSYFAAHGSMASAATPIFEAPSLGGADTVRGFRPDDAIGLRQWAVQSEVRIPLPVAQDGAGQSAGLSLGSMLRQIKLAPLFDAGGAYRTMSSAEGVRAGAGLGARLKLSFLEFGVDWAYAVVGTAATGGSRGKFYFSMKTILPY
jgi:hypothetical protein